MGLYLVLLYSTVLTASERQIIKEKMPQFVYFGKRITTQAMSLSFLKNQYGIRYLWKEYLNPSNPKEEDLRPRQNADQQEV